MLETTNSTRKNAIDVAKLHAVIEPVVSAHGAEVVLVELKNESGWVLRVYVEKTGTEGADLDLCAAISRDLSPALDVADLIPFRYDLEVSSPGLDRPLVRREDYQRFAGFEAKIELNRPVDGRRRFRGKLLGLEGDDVRLLVDAVPLALPLADVTRAKLVITDELLQSGPAQPRH